jgi:hypothetical protein
LRISRFVCAVNHSAEVLVVDHETLLLVEKDLEHRLDLASSLHNINHIKGLSNLPVSFFDELGGPVQLERCEKDPNEGGNEAE